MARINVTSKHIAAGSPRCSVSCPVALAFQEIFPGHEIVVTPKFVRIGGRVHALPYSAMSFITTIDAFGKTFVQPFSFEFPHVSVEKVSIPEVTPQWMVSFETVNEPEAKIEEKVLSLVS